MSAKIIYQSLGTSWAVGIESDNPDDIKYQDYSWYNHGAYKGELHHMSDSFAYIWTTEEKIKRYYHRSSRAKLLNLYEDTLSEEKIERYARLLARLRFNAMKSETFISVGYDGTAHRVAPNTEGTNGCKMSASGYINDEEEWKQGAVTWFNFQS